MSMTVEEAQRILGDWIQSDGGLYCLGQYVAWTPPNDSVTLDSAFTADELEAIAVWMRHKASATTS